MFDMNKCKQGDKLKLRDGTVVEYVKNKSDWSSYPHVILYPDNRGEGVRTNGGYTLKPCRLAFLEEQEELNLDVVGFA
jgi:hypothetical protein